MKSLFLYSIIVLLMMVSCNSPTKKEHQDKLQKVNNMQNRGNEGSEDPDKSINSGKMTDSSKLDTSGRQP